MTTNGNGDSGKGSWPYHLYEGGKPGLQGTYVPCDTNPCHVHGNSEIYAASPEEAYEKAHADDDWGLSDMPSAPSSTPGADGAQPVGDGNASNVNADDSTPGKGTKSGKATAREKATLTARKKRATTAKKKPTAKATVKKATEAAANADGDLEGDDAMAAPGPMVSAVPKGDEHRTDEAAGLAFEQGMYMGGSPLVHYLPDDSYHHPKKRDLVSFAHEVFPGAVCAQEDIPGIHGRSYNAFISGKRAELYAINAYTHSAYKDINGVLRNGYDEDDYHLNDKETIDALIADMGSFMQRPATADVIDRDVVVFRRHTKSEGYHSKLGDEEKVFYKAVAKSMEDGSEPIVKRPDFLSTTWNVPDDWKGMRTGYLIKIPKGTRAVDVSGISGYPDEHELLIDKGYRFKVVGVYETSKLTSYADELLWNGKRPIICLELVPPEGKGKTAGGKAKSPEEAGR